MNQVPDNDLPISNTVPPEDLPNQGSTPLDVASNIQLPGILGYGENIVKDIAGNVAGTAESLKTGLYDIPKAVGILPQEVSHSIVTGEPLNTSLGNITRQGVSGMAQGIEDFSQHPIDTMLKHPVSTALAIKGATDLGDSILPDNAPLISGKLLEKAANIPDKATELKGYNEPTPSQSEIDSAIQKVRDTVKNVWKEHGNVLNKAREDAGIPTSEDEVADSIRKYGNEFGLDLGKPLQLPDNLKMNAPITGDEPIQPFVKGDVVPLKSTVHGMPDLNVKYNGPMMNPPSSEFAKQMGYTPEQLKAFSEPMFNLDKDIPAHAGDVPHPANSTLAKTTLESHGYQVPEGMQKLQVPESMPMPYTIGEHDTPQDLVTEINRFKSNTPYIAPQDQIKAAEYFKDQIVQQGVFKTDTAKGRTMGVLKSQFRDLSDITTQNSPALQEAKSKMSGLYDTMDNINDKLSAGPGQAESYLRRLFTSKSSAIKDDLRALAKIEQLSGQPVLTNLFKKFAGEAYGQSLGQSVHTVFQAPYAALTSPKYIMTPLQRFGPSILKAPLAGISGAGLAATKGFPISSQNNNLSELQSLKDKLNQ